MGAARAAAAHEAKGRALLVSGLAGAAVRLKSTQFPEDAAGVASPPVPRFVSQGLRPALGHPWPRGISPTYR